MKKIILLVIVILGLSVIWALLAFDLLRFNRQAAVDFEDCLVSGGKVDQASPRQCIDLSGQVFEEKLGSITENEDLIRLFEPKPEEMIASSTLSFSGEARGFWFVTPSFAVVLRASDSGQILSSGQALSEGNWLDAGFVKFGGKLSFKVATTTRAELVLKSGNTVGLKKRAELIVPVILELK